MPYNLDSTNTRLVVIGAGDTALHYIGMWGEDWANGPGDALWKSTTPSDSVSLQFHGKRILLDVVSTPNATSSPPTIQWSIDNKPHSTATVQTSSSEWSFQTLINQAGLSDDVHTINVTVVQVSSDNPFLLDSFAFAPSSEFWNDALPTNAASKGSIAPTIVGGIFVGVLLALACISCTVWLRRRRARRFTYSTISDAQEDDQATPKISPFSLRRIGARLACSRSSTIESNNDNIPHSPPPTSEVSTAGATMVSQDSNETRNSIIAQAPKRKGYKLRSSQHIRSFRALVYTQSTNQTIPRSLAPSTPLPQDASPAVAPPSGQGSEPPTPPPLYTA
uniref:MFS domain-containing protein n=1 Tax=Ganoderma boninense TaxID=34458 RepID=A0A5K1K003_9APHY|nr:MFS domain-containing protein [Ganoderma boninense]